jgi:hypothetical protein
MSSSLPFRFFDRNIVFIPTCPAHPILLDLITLYVDFLSEMKWSKEVPEFITFLQGSIQ